MTLGSSLMISADQRNAKNIEYKISLSHCLQNVATIFTYPRAESNKFEDCLESKTHGKGEVHIREEVRQHQRGSIGLRQCNWQLAVIMALLMALFRLLRP